MKKYDVIVVGGGPAGLMAAGQAALAGSSTLLVEKMEQPGRKLLLTGKHRCNLTNSASIPEALKQFNREGRFLTQVFYQFFAPQLRAFFEELGVPTVEQRGGRIFPASEEARDVVSALVKWAESAGVTILTHTRLEGILVESGKVRGLVTDAGEISASAVILATGGKAYPGTGSTGEGLEIAQRLGHSIAPLRPALVPLKTAGTTAQELQGLSLSNVQASLSIDGRSTDQLFGELLFTHFGLSGPVILTLSREIVQALDEGRQVEVSIDLKPALSVPTLDARLLRDIQEMGRKQFSSLLEGLLPKALIPVCAAQTGIPWSKKNSQLTGEERKRLIDWLKGGFKFQITGHQGFVQAIITAGGIDTREVDPRTMESKLVQGLYFAGEILDVDANTGGFNLQAAFSTGWAAGIAAAATSGKNAKNKG